MASGPSEFEHSENFFQEKEDDLEQWARHRGIQIGFKELELDRLSTPSLSLSSNGNSEDLEFRYLLFSKGYEEFFPSHSSKSTTKDICCKVGFRDKYFRSRLIEPERKYQIKVRLTGPKETEFPDLVSESIFNQGWECFYKVIRFSPPLGIWMPGVYRAEVFVQGDRVGLSWFYIYHNENDVKPEEFLDMSLVEQSYSIPVPSNLDFINVRFKSEHEANSDLPEYSKFNVKLGVNRGLVFDIDSSMYISLEIHNKNASSGMGVIRYKTLEYDLEIRIFHPNGKTVSRINKKVKADPTSGTLEPKYLLELKKEGFLEPGNYGVEFRIDRWLMARGVFVLEDYKEFYSTLPFNMIRRV